MVTAVDSGTPARRRAHSSCYYLDNNTSWTRIAHYYHYVVSSTRTLNFNYRPTDLRCIKTVIIAYDLVQKNMVIFQRVIVPNIFCNRVRAPKNVGPYLSTERSGDFLQITVKNVCYNIIHRFNVPFIYFTPLSHTYLFGRFI